MDDQTREQEIFNCPHCGYRLDAPEAKCSFCGAQTHIRLPVDDAAPQENGVSPDPEAPSDVEASSDVETPSEVEASYDGELPQDAEPDESAPPLSAKKPKAYAAPDTDAAPDAVPPPVEGGIYQTVSQVNKTKLGFGIALLVIGIIEFLNCLITIVTETEVFGDPDRTGGYDYSAPFTSHETVVIWVLVLSLISAAAGIFLIVKSKNKKE